MNAYLTHVVNYLLNQSWQIALLTVVVALVTFLLRNKNAHIRYLLWLIVLAKCLIPPLFVVPVTVLPQESFGVRPFGSEQTEITAEFQTIAASTSDLSGNGMEPENMEVSVFTEPAVDIEVTNASKLTWAAVRIWLGIIWIIGVVVYLAVNVLKAIATRCWLQRERRPLEPELQIRVSEFFGAHGIKRLPKIWAVEDASQPFVWGFLRGIIYIPADLLNVDSLAKQRNVLAHELSHIMRYDATVNLLQVIAQTIFWFHPFIWWANHKIRQEREKCCDEMAVAGMNTSPKDYTRAIVEALATERQSAHPVPSLAIVGSVKNIEERIKTMLRPGKKFYKRPSIIAATMVIFIALLTVPTAFVLTARARAGMASESTESLNQSLHDAVALNNIEEVRRLISSGADVNAKNERGFTPLIWGTYQSSLSREVAELLIEAGADVDSQDSDGMTALHNAIFVVMGMDVITVLADNSADINLADNEGSTPLHYAVDMEDLEIVRLLVDKGADFNMKNQDGWTAFSRAALYGCTDITDLFIGKGADTSSFHMAAFIGDLSRVKELVGTGTEVDTKDEFGWTALFWAACAGQTEVAEFLIENNANLNVQDNSDRSLLHQAAQAPKDATGFVELLIARGADVNAKTSRGDTPLILACYPGNKKVVELLIANGADVNAKNNPGRTPLHAVALTSHVDVAEVLISKGADIDAELNIPFTRYTPLHNAAMRDVNMVTILIDKGSDINASSGTFGRTPFHQAVITGKTDIVKFLIDKGVDINSPDIMPGITPLAWAVCQGHKDIIELLVTNEADINVSDNTGHTPLDMAMERGDTEIIDLLQEHGAIEGTPTLLQAVTSGDVEQVRLLVSQGADVNVKNNAGQTLLHIACQRGNKEIMELLIDNKADIEAQNNNYQTPLHIACQRGNKEIVELLIENNANIGHTPDERYGSTALHIAATSGHKDIVELLIDKGADIEAKNSDGSSPLNNISGYGSIYTRNPQGQHEIIELLIDKGANIETRSHWDCTPLYLSISVNRPKVAELLLKRGAKIDTLNKFWGTLAHGAMRANLPELVRWSIEEGVDIPPLHQAAYFGDIDKVKALISEGADVNQKDVAEFTALHCATLGQNTEIAQLLIDNDADIEAKNCGNRTPLYDLCHTGYLEMVKLLVENGADVNTTGNHRDEFSSDGIADDWTPLHVAAHAGRAEVAEYLLTKGADIQAKCSRWEHGSLTALHLAALLGRLNVVEVLLANGADINSKTDKGDTPASLAEKNEYPEIVNMLLGKPIVMAEIIESAQTWRPAFTEWHGKPAPDFTITDITGKQHKISDYRDKNLILNFWATWCGPCLREIPDIITLRNNVSEDELAILGISTEKGQTDLVKEFAEKEKMNYTILVSEGTLIPPYSEISAIPTTFIIDPEGNIKIATVGTLTLNDLNNLLSAQ